jgi:hypothetical protein
MPSAMAPAIGTASKVALERVFVVVEAFSRLTKAVL